MGVSGLLSDNEGEGEDKTSSSPIFTYTKVFEDVFPYYLAIGMTYSQFWQEDSSLVKAYRKAEELRNKKKNEELWLQGAYIYEALCDVSPVLHAFAKKGTKPIPYKDKPFDITKQDVKKTEEAKEKANMEKGLAQLEALKASFNKKKSSKTE